VKKRVVVTGLGIISPIGNDVSTFWENLLNGVSGVGVIKAFDTEGFPTRIAAEVLDFDPLNYFNNKESKRMDRVTMLGIAAAQEAIENSGLLKSCYNSERVGVVTGSGIGGISTFETQHELILKKVDELSAHFLFQ